MCALFSVWFQTALVFAGLRKLLSEVAATVRSLRRSSDPSLVGTGVFSSNSVLSCCALSCSAEFFFSFLLQRGFELAAKLQREEENRSATRLAADAEMSRQLFAQLNQHLLPAALSSRTAQPVGATLTSPRDDAVSSGYSSEWLDRLREQHEEEESRQQRYSAFPTQAGEDK